MTSYFYNHTFEPRHNKNCVTFSPPPVFTLGSLESAGSSPEEHPTSLIWKQLTDRVLLSPSRVFVNRSLAMEKIKCFGFDMDYTLAGECTQPIWYIYTNCFCNSSETGLANLS